MQPTTESVFAEITAANPRTVPEARALRRRISKQIATFDRKDVIALAVRLRQEARFGHFLGCELVQNHKRTTETITRVDVERLAEGISSWDQVDVFACYISGPAWRENRISDRVVTSWAKSPDRWWRRAALVSTVPLNSPALGGTSDVARTLAMCSLLAEDSDDMVVKAMSWALRALSKSDPDAVRAFLAKNKNKLAARVIREVTNKLTTGLKNPKPAVKGSRAAPARARSPRKAP